MLKLLSNKYYKKVDLLIIVFSFAVFAFTLISVFRIVITTAPDFTVLYKSAEDLMEGVNPYTDKKLHDPFLYPTATAFFYLPFAVLPYQAAQGLFVILSALSVLLIVYCSLKSIDKKFSWRHILIFSSLAFLSFPVKFTLGMGQSNLLASLLLIVGFYFYKRQKLIACGILLSLAFFFKPILSFILLFFLLKRAWKLLVVIFTACVVLIFFSSVFYGFDKYVYYLGTVAPSLLTTDGREVYYNQSVTGLISRLTEDILLRKYVALFINVVAIVSVFYLGLRKKVNDTVLFAIFIALIPFAHSLSWQHHFAILIFPFIVAATELIKIKKYWLLILLFLAYLLWSWNIKDPSFFTSFPSVLFLSHILYGDIILLFLLANCSLRRTK